MTPAGQPITGCRILIIEDEYLIASALALALRAKGAEVIGPVGRLEQAEAKVREGGFDVAALDINLQDKHAYSIADELRRQCIPFVFVTGYSAEVIPAAYADVPYFDKPCNMSQLLRHFEVVCPVPSAGHLS